MQNANDSIELDTARRAGYRITVHDRFFPFESTTPGNPGTVHAKVDHAVQAIYCSQEYYNATRPVSA